MPEVTYLLKPDGTIEELPKDSETHYHFIDGETDPIALELPADEPIVIAFNGAADGRGFSLVNTLRQNCEYHGHLYAAGFINPDQLSFAFQTGFDGVLVSADRWEEYGVDSWRAALGPVVNLSYALMQSDSIESIWQRRHRA